MAFIVGNICLIAIDLIYSDQRWFYWVLLPWLIVLIFHLVLTASSVRRRYFEWESMLAQPPAHNDAERGS